MIIEFESKKRIASLIDAANAKTGKSDTDLTAAVGSLIAGFGQDGAGEAIGTDDTLSSITGMLYALTSGNFVHGSFTLANPLPNTETLVLSTGLEKINGLLIAADEFPRVHETANQRIGMFLYLPDVEIVNALNWSYYHTTVSVKLDVIVQGKTRIDGGDFYVTAAYNGNYNYTPFAPGVTYTWVAW